MRARFRRVAIRLAAVPALALGLACAAFADTRATLSRDAIALDETVTLTLDTDIARGLPDLAPLNRDFVVVRMDSGRQFSLSNGRIRSSQRFAIELRPRRVGVLPLPAIAIGQQRSQPLRLTVAAATAVSSPPPADDGGARGPVFVETELSDSAPYVQQSVGVTVRLHYALDLFNGELRQPDPEGASLTSAGHDSRTVRVVGGREYRVLERHYLLVPERSGVLRLPGAGFQGEGERGFFDGLFGDGRETIRANAAPRTLRVRPMPVAAREPWLPARSVSMRVAPPPAQAKAGEAFDVVVELRADGATAAQLPALEMRATGEAQVFAEPARPTENFVDGRPRVVMTRRFSVVPSAAGVLELRMMPVPWWDVAADAPRDAGALPIRVRVAGSPAAGTANGAAPPTPARRDDDVAKTSPLPAMRWPWRAGGIVALALALLALAAWRLVRRARGQAAGWRELAPEPIRKLVRRACAAGADTAQHASSTEMQRPAGHAGRAEWRAALAAGDLAALARLLPALAEPPAASLGEARARLAAADQRHAVDLLECARWADGDAESARRALRAAFARGPRWRPPARVAKPLLPPLYPER
ncbi:protein BatD [Lysobacter pythonis]|uniref:Protein BatD n=1 Tax=Solilutibacter pythonis TaxID=2483112 RepID=A0A3M2HZI6_9GAMM|nr:BatD family protein [Lysobacter pythonis]RMH93283.1 protein BatD [Lysobacter pythonis]